MISGEEERVADIFNVKIDTSTDSLFWSLHDDDTRAPEQLGERGQVRSTQRKSQCR